MSIFCVKLDNRNSNQEGEGPFHYLIYHDSSREIWDRFLLKVWAFPASFGEVVASKGYHAFQKRSQNLYCPAYLISCAFIRERNTRIFLNKGKFLVGLGAM